MIISAVADPRIFSTGVIVNEFAKREVVRFLQAIAESGVLIDDPDHTLLHESLINARSLPTQLGQRILLLLQELLTKAKKYLVSTGSRIVPQVYATNLPLELSRTAAIMRADAVVVARSEVSTFPVTPSFQVQFGTIAIEDWSEHPLEAHRVQLINRDRPFDELTSREREERVGRAVKYVTSIRIFDYLLVASEQRASKYCDGILYFLAIWKKWSLLPPQALSVEVYTVGNKQTPNGFLSGTEATVRLNNHIVEPIARALSCSVKGIVKQDLEQPLFHARFIQAKARAYSLDPGFDACNNTGPIRRCFFRLEPAGERHLSQCVNLRNAI